MSVIDKQKTPNRKLVVEICMNDASAYAAEKFWTARGYSQSFDMGDGGQYIAYERGGIKGADTRTIGSGAVGDGEEIWVRIFRKDT